MPYSSVSTVDFKQVIADWGMYTQIWTWKTILRNFCENIQLHETIVRLFSVSLENYFLKD